jgi:hypothetical protein
MPNQHELIADLESEIDALRDEAERCRKIDIAARVAFALGCIILFTDPPPLKWSALRYGF